MSAALSWCPQAGDPARAQEEPRHDPRDPARLYAAANHDIWGPLVARSTDRGRTWTDRNQTPKFPEDAGLSVKAAWHIRPGHPDRPGEVWAGVDPGALFRSHDWGENWEPVPGLNEHPTREGWQPGAGDHWVLLADFLPPILSLEATT